MQENRVTQEKKRSIGVTEALGHTEAEKHSHIRLNHKLDRIDGDEITFMHEADGAVHECLGRHVPTTMLQMPLENQPSMMSSTVSHKKFDQVIHYDISRK